MSMYFIKSLEKIRTLFTKIAPQSDMIEVFHTERGFFMRLRTRLWVTFAIIVVLPLLLATCSIISISYYVRSNASEAYGLKKVEWSMVMDPVKGFTRLTNREYQELKVMAQENPQKLEDMQYLQAMNGKLAEKSSYLMVRRGENIIYAGNEKNSGEIMESLGTFGYPVAQDGFYYDSLSVVVKQVNFTAADGQESSVFIITHVTNFLNKRVVRNTIIIVILILVITGYILTRWIHKGVFVPIRDLNTAMENIAEGNLDYTLPMPNPKRMHKGEIELLYVNYEQMRLRLKESAEEKIQTDNRNRELISNISHDLKTPITSIKGYVEGIIDGIADTPEKVDKYVRTIYNKTNDMDRLINELTTYSNIDANRIPYHFHKINVADYFNDCVVEVGLDLESKGIRLNYTNLVEPDTLIIADPEQLKRVVNNIVSNSVKYMNKQEGRIDIRILDQVDSVRVEIEDNGKGVSPKELGRIFERFYRTDASRNSAQGGSGIGLSIVKKIVEDHGGYIWATSREGEGTCMHFDIRKYNEQA